MRQGIIKKSEEDTRWQQHLYFDTNLKAQHLEALPPPRGLHKAMQHQELLEDIQRYISGQRWRLPEEQTPIKIT